MTSGKLRSEGIGTELTERQRLILGVLVDEHVSTTRPIGSKTLADRAELDISSATIRNEMAELEECGYLQQPHTSAGRVPTQKAYRFYVNNLAVSQELSLDKLSWIHSQYRRVEPDPDKILRLSTKLLADTVKHPAVAVEPGPPDPRLTGITVKPVSGHAIRIGCTYSDGRQHEFVVRSDKGFSIGQVNRLSSIVKQQLNNLSAARLSEQVAADDGEQTTFQKLLDAVRRQLWASGEGHVYVEGTAYILEQPEFQQLPYLQAVVKALGEQQMWRQLLTMAGTTQQVTVVIGSEHAIPQLEQCSTVLSRFRGPSNQRGILGVVGPMRMAYPEVMSTVNCVARQVGEALTITDTQHPH